MKTQEIIDKLKKGLDAEYYLVASGSTRTKDNKDLRLTIKEAQQICSLLDVVHRRELLLAAICEYNKFNTQKDIKAVDEWLDKWDSK